MNHKFKLFNVEWSLIPIYIFIGVCAGFGMFILNMYFMFEDNVLGAILTFIGLMLFVYVATTITNHNEQKQKKLLKELK